jgi:ABC-type phosphate/phosphonate transport system substrate-binding protein
MESLQPMVRPLAFVCFIAASLIAWASAAADLTFAVTEGITYYQTNREIQARFQPLADVLSTAVRRPVRIVIVSAYADLREGLDRQAFDIAFVHPAHIALAAIKNGKYRSLAWTAGYTQYSVSLLIDKNAPYTKLEDLRGHTIVSPDPDSITAAMMRALLRERGIAPDALKIITTRYQDAVPFYVENNFAQAGATAAGSVISAWAAKGGKLIATSRPVPIKQIIGAVTLAPEDEERIRNALLGMAQTENGRHALGSLGYKGFVRSDRETELAVIAWLGL